MSNEPDNKNEDNFKENVRIVLIIRIKLTELVKAVNEQDK